MILRVITLVLQVFQLTAKISSCSLNGFSKRENYNTDWDLRRPADALPYSYWESKVSPESFPVLFLSSAGSPEEEGSRFSAIFSPFRSISTPSKPSKPLYFGSSSFLIPDYYLRPDISKTVFGSNMNLFFYSSSHLVHCITGNMSITGQ